MSVYRRVLTGPYAGSILKVKSFRLCSGKDCAGEWHKLTENQDIAVAEVLFKLPDGNLYMTCLSNTEQVKEKIYVETVGGNVRVQRGGLERRIAHVFRQRERRKAKARTPRGETSAGQKVQG